MSFVQKITMSDAKVKFGSLSLNNQYQVQFTSAQIRYDFILENAIKNTFFGARQTRPRQPISIDLL